MNNKYVYGALSFIITSLLFVNCGQAKPIVNTQNNYELDAGDEVAVNVSSSATIVLDNATGTISLPVITVAPSDINSCKKIKDACDLSLAKCKMEK